MNGLRPKIAERVDFITTWNSMSWWRKLMRWNKDSRGGAKIVPTSATPLPSIGRSILRGKQKFQPHHHHKNQNLRVEVILSQPLVGSLIHPDLRGKSQEKEYAMTVASSVKEEVTLPVNTPIKEQ